jgi:hypothetical protein
LPLSSPKAHPSTASLRPLLQHAADDEIEDSPFFRVLLDEIGYIGFSIPRYWYCELIFSGSTCGWNILLPVQVFCLLALAHARANKRAEIER